MKHEQIILAGLGYIIGFVTAFIAFGLSSGHHQKQYRYHADDRGGYGLVEKVARKEKQAAPKMATTISDATVTNDGLFVTLGGEERIVSVASIDSSARLAGTHYAISETLVSPSKEYLYYCALLAAGDTECRSYIYSAVTDTVYPVKDVAADVYLDMPAAELAITWTEENVLVINGRQAASGDEPWMIE